MNPPKLSFSCPARSAVVGAGPIRFCHLCDRAVHDLSAMTAEEAQQFQALCVGREVCVSYQTEATPTGLRVRHRPVLGRITLALGLGLGGLVVATTDRPAADEAPAPGGGVQDGLPTDTLRATVRSALLEAEQGWPEVDHARARRTALADETARPSWAEAQAAENQRAWAHRYVPPPAAPPVLLGTWAPETTELRATAGDMAPPTR